MVQQFEFPEDATPISDCSALIPVWVHHLHDLNRVEAENIMQAQVKYLSAPIDNPKKWFHTTELRTIHQAMFKNVWKRAGFYRKSVTSIGIKPGLIPSQLAELCCEVLSWMQEPVELTFVEMAAKIHYRLVSIHPFENGNGRFSRLIADRFLFAFKCSAPLWPDNLNQESTMRKEYIQTLKYADKGDLIFLIEFMKKLGAKDPHLSELFKGNFYRAYMKGDKGLATVNALLRDGGNPNDQTLDGHRLLQLAIKLGLEKIIERLINAGAEVNVKDQSGLTPFQTAVMQGNKTIADFLISKGAAKLSLPK